MTTDITFVPLLPIWLIFALTTLGVAGSLLRLRTAPWGVLFRILTISLLAFALFGPTRTSTEGELQPDIVLLLEDQSRSLTFGDRDALAADAGERTAAALEAEGYEVRRTRFGDRVETNLETALPLALADVPRPRLSAILLLSDGQLHGNLDQLDLPAGVPVHSIATGAPSEERDRRVEIVEAPSFGVVGERVDITLKLHAIGETDPIPTQLFVGGEPYAEQTFLPDQEVTLSVRLSQPGETIIELLAEPREDELTTLNNRAVVSLTAVRDRLRVLLISGEPHAGERVWRNTLKSDPAVDLVHFTILKPAEKVVSARREELNLIEFPHEELFLEKLSSFNVVIFDRYTYRYVLEAYEFEEIARYVERGGAVLIASGPEMSEPTSLAERPNLAYILPILPNGKAQSGAFIPSRSDTGVRHPITSPLTDEADWGRWLRYIPGQQRAGETLLQAPNATPLLVVDRVEQGRIAVLMSDHVWLWARGFDGGGPYQELLRRLVHWLMQEPDLDEEALRGDISTDGILTISRQSLSDNVLPVTIIDPDDGTETIELVEDDTPGQFTAQLPATAEGLYRLETRTEDGEQLYALAALGDKNIAELGAVETTSEHLSGLGERSGGGVYGFQQIGDRLPGFRPVAADTNRMSAAGWAGLPRRNSRLVDKITVSPLLPAPVLACLIGATALAAWLLEAKLFRRRT